MVPLGNAGTAWATSAALRKARNGQPARLALACALHVLANPLRSDLCTENAYAHV